MPLFATAHATHIPRHILVTAEENPTTGAFTRADLTSWTLNCPGEPVPPGGAAPDALRRLDLPGTLPSFPVGCVRWNLTPIPSMQVVVQNWLPEDVRGQDAAAGLATAPLGANQFAFFATRSHHALSSEALRAFGAKVNGVKRATVDMTAPPAGGTGVRLYLERGGVTAADDSMQLVGDVDLRDSASDALNTGMRVSSSATITDLPDTMRIDYANTPTTPFRFTWRAGAGIALDEWRVRRAAAGAYRARSARRVRDRRSRRRRVAAGRRPSLGSERRPDHACVPVAQARGTERHVPDAGRACIRSEHDHANARRRGDQHARTAQRRLGDSRGTPTSTCRSRSPSAG